MYRDPNTNRSAEGFAVTGNDTTPDMPMPATTPRGGNIHGGWDYIAQPGQDADGKGGVVYAVVDVLGVKSLDVKDSHKQTGNIGPEPASTNDGPIGQGGTDAPKG